MSVQSLDRAFDILELLSREGSGVSLTEISARLDLNKSTVYRILASLKTRGYVAQSPETKAYRLGLEFIELASLYLNSLELKTEAQPLLKQLSRQTGQTVFMAIRQGKDIVYIDKVETYDSLRRYQIIGRRLPLHCTSLGKALLTGLSESEIAQLYNEEPFQRLTEFTILDLATLQKEIELTRRRGWSVDNQENELGTTCVGAPVYDYRDQVIAAVSVAWEADQASLDPKNLAGFVVQATQELSRRMGYRWKIGTAEA